LILELLGKIRRIKETLLHMYLLDGRGHLNKFYVVKITGRKLIFLR